MGKKEIEMEGGATALHSVHSHVFRGVVIVAGSNLARSHGCVRVCHSRMSSLWGARKNFAFLCAPSESWNHSVGSWRRKVPLFF